MSNIANRVFALGLLMLLLWTGDSWAHGLRAVCRFRGEQVQVIAKFSDGAMARKAAVEVRDGDKNLLHSGTTDSQGQWSFPKPAPGEYHIRVNAGAGHLAHMTLTISENQDDRSVQTNMPDDSSFFYWAKIITGISVIGVVCLALLVAKRSKAS